MDIQTFFLNRYFLLRNLVSIAGLVKYKNPVSLLFDLKKYPWLKTLLKANNLHRKLAYKRKGAYLKATGETVSYVIKCVVYFIGSSLSAKERLIIHEDMVPPEIFHAMGLVPFMAEFPGIAMPLVEPHSVEEYIDESENYGIPPDICSLPKSTLGMSIMKHFPPGKVIVSSNLPCDGGMSSYSVIEKLYDVPTFRLDIPHNFYSEKASVYFVKELRRMIKWLEENTPGKMDWDRLKEICEERNRMIEYELDLWEMIRARPAPMAGEPVYLSHLLASNVLPGSPISTGVFRKISAICRKNFIAGKGVIQDEKFRCLLWNPPLLHTGELFNWAEQAYGVTLIMDSMSFNRRKPYIDTSSEESMLKGIGLNIMEGPMARHTRGPAVNYTDDIFRIIKQFDIDMLWVAGHVGCKNTAALNGMLREMCRERGVPMLIINYDLSDPRVVSKQGILAQIDHFMEIIMKVKRDTL